MKTRLAVAAAAALIAGTLPVAAAQHEPVHVTVGLSAAQPHVAMLFGAPVVRRGDALGYVVVETRDPKGVEARARADRSLRYVSRSGRMNVFASPNDLLYGQQWTHGPPPGLNTEPAWSVEGGTRTISVAVVDTGIDDTHPDLIGRVSDRVVVCAACVPGDQLGHGTQVAGVIAASTDNVHGIAGVADVSLIDVEVVAPDGASFEDVADGIVAAADLGADVINLSLGCELPCYAPVVHDALVYAASKGSLPVCAAGNASGGVGYPAYDAACMAVSAIDRDGSLGVFSNSGPTIELSAPGVDIATTAVGGSYTIGVGTSLAAPHVSGVAALVLSGAPTMSAAALRAHLKATATPASLPPDKGGAGWLNACKALGASGCDSTTGLLPRTASEPYVAAGGLTPPIPMGPLGCGPVAFFVDVPVADNANLGGACLGIYGPESSVTIEIDDLHGMPVAAGYAFLHVSVFGESEEGAGPLCGDTTLAVPAGANQLRIWVTAPPALFVCPPGSGIAASAGTISATFA